MQSPAAVVDVIRRSQTASPSPLARNPVSLRLYKVLGATFDDEATREALSTLSDLYSPSESRLITKEDDISHDSADETDGEKIKDVPSFLRGALPGDTAAKARKHLRRDIESKLEEGSLRFLAAFGAVDQKLDALQAHITAMRARCEEAQAQLQSTDEACKSLLDRAGTLRDEQQEVKTRQSIPTALSSSNVPVGPTFFAAMDRAQAIRDDCRVLMVGEDSPSKAGLDVMAVTAAPPRKGIRQALPNELSEAAAPPCVRAQSSSRAPPPPSPPLPSRMLTNPPPTQRSTHRARADTPSRHPLLLHGCTDHGQRDRPLPAHGQSSCHAHDALRYIGDMLAWVHQAIAAEREFLEALLGIDAGARMPGAVRAPAHAADEWLGELMDAAVAGLCGPLRARVLQTVRAQESALSAYKVARLLQFYALTMARTLGARALLATTLRETTAASYAVFFDAIAAQGPFLAHTQDLRAILALHTAEADDDAAANQSGGGENEGATIERALDALVDPAVQMCVHAAEEKDAARRRNLPASAMTTEVGPPRARKRETLHVQVEARVRELINEHYENVLRDSGLHDAVHACEHASPDEPLSLMPACAPAALRGALSAFAHWLASLEAVHAPRLAALTAPFLHARCAPSGATATGTGVRGAVRACA
ncbi:oligomeric complex COG6 [Lactarius vividus]|nr:oligomeric complex COG6 [Lactarius vividus]